MRIRTIIYLRWILINRVEIFPNLGKMFDKYTSDNIGVSRNTLNKKNLYKGYTNSTVEIIKYNIS